MQKRYSDFISLLKAHNKSGSEHCDMVVNGMCITTLRLLRENGLIRGFSLVNSSQRKKLYPRATVYLNFCHRWNPAIADIRLFKNTGRDFTPVSYLSRKGLIGRRKLYLISNMRGLQLMSLPELLKNNLSVEGRVLVEFTV